MTALRPGQVAELLGVSVDTVRRMADSGRLPTRRSASGERIIDGEELARHLDAHAASAELAPIVATSARNRFAGIVTRVAGDAVVATVELRSGPHRIVSIMTAEAVDDLGLRPGVLAGATVKSTNVVVEVATP
jgi:molybdopterin-binding protein